MRTKRIVTVATVILWLAGSATAGWVTSGNNMYSDVTGNVGIGTTSPGAKLEIGSSGNLLLKATAENIGDIIFQTRTGMQKGRIWTDPAAGVPTLYLSSGDNAADLTVDRNGKVGIRTASPSASLDVNGHIAISYSDPYLRTNSTDKHVVISGGNGWVSTGAAMVLRGANAGYNAHGMDIYTGGSERVRILSNGNVGIGTVTPNARLHVVADATDREGVAAYGYAKYTGNDARGASNYGGYFVASGPPPRVGMLGGETGTGIYAKGGRWAGDFDGPVRIGGYASIIGNLTISKRISDTAIDILIQLGEGLDYAEGFDVSDTSEVGPGSVLVIDAENPGELKQSDTAYDTKVAGIVAGAGGLGSGVRLGGSEFDHDVALAGRVYCNVDATEAGVQPGDLLTTSATPGYAMKAVEYARAQGAILGKAMERLEEGKKAQILVLVTLQ